MSAGNVGSARESSKAGNYKRGLSQTGSRGSSSFEERCVDPIEPELQAPQKTSNGGECDSFLPSSSEPPNATQNCNPCASPKACKTLMCSVLTCGLYRVCLRAPCLGPKEPNKECEEPEELSLRAENPADHKEEEEDDTDWLGDVCFAGVKVDSPRDYIDADSVTYVRQTQPCHVSLQEVIQWDDWGDEDEENVDSLITKKLLELYTEYQIEELARCTTDSVFLRKTNKINQLINSLAEEHQMGEQEAESRLVRGIIRISTRRSKKKKRPVASRPERTLTDSGNETMRESDSFVCSNNNDYKSNPNIQISELTSSDKCARDMWRNNRGRTSDSTSTSYSPSNTETDSSGFPLIRTSVRT
ncbi:uncharacterized protein LOC130910342 [Corythoichthys intestinalis]|uniref:uncharacterized protein LOC130910342 n=1 Tax=Corythoichthys intestinalis TaxID=161448 RepID=UPI0025A5A246|nr:uncharacterized protein LOC130910342 [Corythoichthys intestinalis]XP_061808271.1 uncharacterized protein LOC133599474 [Nerophis lumbriciformis]